MGLLVGIALECRDRNREAPALAQRAYQLRDRLRQLVRRFPRVGEAQVPALDLRGGVQRPSPSLPNLSSRSTVGSYPNMSALSNTMGARL
jgi:hypothetical protein